MFRVAQRSKYNVRIDAAGVAARTYSGVRYDSLGEARYAAELDLKCRMRQILSWDRQFKVPLEVAGIRLGNMVVDFRVLELDGTYSWVEFKGMRTALFNWKEKHLRAQYPGQKYMVVKK